MGRTRSTGKLVSDGIITPDITNDRVGIGSTSPQFKLDVSGDINFTGTFYQNSSPFVASRWTAGTGDDIYRLNGDVGIGTTNPQFTLDVLGDINFTGTFYQNGSPFVASRWTAGTGDDIYRLNGDVGIGTTNPNATLDVNGSTSIASTLTVNGSTSIASTLTVNGSTSIASTLTANASLDGLAFQSYELDDFSGSINGLENTFTPRFNYEIVTTITNPFQLLITVDGIQQSAFINNTDYVWQSHFLGSNDGYTIDTDNNIKFTESIPTGSNIDVRVLPVSNTPTKIRLYPFKPADILLGY